LEKRDFSLLDDIANEEPKKAVNSNKNNTNNKNENLNQS